MNVLGIMSGTSLDGVDYVVCSFSHRGAMRFCDHWHRPFPRELKSRLFRAATGQAGAHDLAQLHHDLGRFYARGAAPAASTVDLAGLHGQTIFHRPHRTAPATMQIGEPSWLAEALRVPVIANFRAADLAAGGQGAPLATIFHQHVFASKGRHIAVNNLGGISNVTSLDWRKGASPKILAFDTGPANMLIDFAAQKASGGRRVYDRGGNLARRGRIHEPLLQQLLAEPFFRQKPPKSTGRELFGADRFANAASTFRLNDPDFAATITELTARSIELNYRLHLPSMPDEVILCGGGALNPLLHERIAAALKPHGSLVTTSKDHGWAPHTIEAAAFALLAWLRWKRRPGNLPQTTGASGPRLLGQIVEA